MDANKTCYTHFTCNFLCPLSVRCVSCSNGISALSLCKLLRVLVPLTTELRPRMFRETIVMLFMGCSTLTLYLTSSSCFILVTTPTYFENTRCCIQKNTCKFGNFSFSICFGRCGLFFYFYNMINYFSIMLGEITVHVQCLLVLRSPRECNF